MFRESQTSPLDTERLDCRWVHVNSIIPNNLRICPVADKHGGQLSEKKKERETEVSGDGVEKGLPVPFTTIDDKNPRREGRWRTDDGGPPHYVCTSPAKPTSSVFSVCRRVLGGFLRSLSIGIFDRKNPPESRTSLLFYSFLFFFFLFLVIPLCTIAVHYINITGPGCTDHKLTRIKRLMFAYCTGRASPYINKIGIRLIDN